MPCYIYSTQSCCSFGSFIHQERIFVPMSFWKWVQIHYGARTTYAPPQDNPLIDGNTRAARGGTLATNPLQEHP